MRVALLSYNARAGDAIGNQVAEKLAFFLDRGADVRVFVECDRGLHPAVRPHCQALPPEPRGDGWRFVSSADLVVVEYGQAYALLQLLPLLRAGRGRILFDYHGVTPPALWPAHNREPIEKGTRQRGLAWCADAAVVHSDFTRRELQDATSFPAERITCLGHPVDSRFAPGPGALRRRLGGDAVSVLLFVGRLAPNKRLPTLVQALHRLRARRPAVHAVVIGAADDLYQGEARRCRELAAALGIADRLHLLGRLDEEQLRDAYRSADVFVMPSRHEGFCIPVIEAMASGVPVVAARSTALPETVGEAGLTFAPDDADDLARQVGRVLDARAGSAILPESGKRRVAVVSFRFGGDFAGGAETSLRTIAGALHQAGHHVEVFATCTRRENDWSNQLPEGTRTEEGLPVHRYRLDPHQRGRHLESVRAILQGEGQVSLETEREYLEHSIHSTRLVEDLARRAGEFDAIITGPYLFGLTLDVARAFPDKTLVLPCFHDEPFARLRAWNAYEGVAGILYHSPEEQAFAEIRLGLNHPGAVCVDALIDTEAPGRPTAGQELAPAGRPYLVYCGRYSAQKGVPTLLEYARRYLERHPERFGFVFLGQGEVAIPKHPGFRDLGFVGAEVKRDVLAGAAALVQLSRHESLSLVALEALAQGTPVLADARCPVLAGHLQRSGAGRAVASFEEFAAALDELAARPADWRALGAGGREYVRTRYGSREKFTRKLEQALADMTRPLAERMRERGLRRATRFGRDRWREQFAHLVEVLLDGGPRPYGEEVEIKPRSAERTVAAGSGPMLVPVRIANRGSDALLADGPGRLALVCRVEDEAGAPVPGGAAESPLPGLLMPGRALAAAVPVPVPPEPGTYRVTFGVRFAADGRHCSVPCAGGLQLVVAGAGGAASAGCCSPLLDTVQAALVEADRLQRLPDDYTDVTEGLFAAVKRRIKRKLLGNFKHAYVDVLSRQQSALNQQLLTALRELAECCATLDHVRQPGTQAALVDRLGRELAEWKQRCAGLEERLARLEVRAAEERLVANPQ